MDGWMDGYSPERKEREREREYPESAVTCRRRRRRREAARAFYADSRRERKYAKRNGFSRTEVASSDNELFPMVSYDKC